jgi:hypothetical protein
VRRSRWERMAADAGLAQPGRLLVGSSLLMW